MEAQDDYSVKNLHHYMRLYRHMSLHVHFYRITFSDYSAYFRKLLDSDIFITEGKSIPTPADYELLVHPTPSKAWLEASRALRAVVIPWAGISEETCHILSNYPRISLHNLHHNNFNTAEMGFGLLLAAAKLIIPFDSALRRNDWSPRYQNRKAVLLRGKSALILGFGEIGKAFCSYCLGIGMKVMATKKHMDEDASDLNVAIYPNTKLHELLPNADIMIIALPLTQDTKDLIGKNELDLMPQGSILVNIGRGPIVNQYALYDALTNGHLRAAASDVWYNYPESEESRINTPPADVPFGDLDNFVLSPHRGGMVEDVERQRAEALAALLNAANRGETIPNAVDLNAGY